MWQWIFFWRRQESPKTDAARPDADQSPESKPPQTEPELSSMPEQRRNEMNVRWKDTRTLTVVRSNAARAVEAQPVEDEPKPKPVLVLPIEAGAIAQPGEDAATKAEEDEGSSTGKGDASDWAKSGRIAYFTRGCYAVARLGRPRLTAPDLMLNNRRGRSPLTLPKPNGTAAAKPGNAQRSPAAPQ